MIIPTSRFITCLNGEIIEPNTGLVVGYIDFYSEPSLSTDARTLLRHWDGVSSEPLGWNTPKIICISKAEQRLLSRLHPWKFLKYAVKQDYLELIDKINRHNLSMYRSINMKKKWADPASTHRLSVSSTIIALRADPLSIYNSSAYRINHILGCREAWKNPIAIENKSIAITASWIKRRGKFGYSGFSKEGLLRIHRGQKKPKIWETRRDLYGERGVKNPQKYSESLSKGQKRRWMWNRLAQMFEMLFGDIVDEDAETYPCPHCNRVFSSKTGVGVHMNRMHKEDLIQNIYPD